MTDAKVAATEAPDPESLAAQMPTASEALSGATPPDRKERTDKGQSRSPRRKSWTKGVEESLTNDIAAIVTLSNVVVANVPKLAPYMLLPEEITALTEAVVGEFKENPRLLSLATRAQGVSAHVKLLTVLGGIVMRRVMMTIAQRQQEGNIFGNSQRDQPSAASDEPPAANSQAPIPVGARRAPGSSGGDGERKDISAEPPSASAFAVES